MDDVLCHKILLGRDKGFEVESPLLRNENRATSKQLNAELSALREQDFRVPILDLALQQYSYQNFSIHDRIYSGMKAPRLIGHTPSNHMANVPM